MESGELRIDVNQLRATASHWNELSTEFSVLSPPAAGQPFQSTAAAVGSLHAAVGLAAVAFTVRTQATASAVEAGAADYVNDEASAAAEMAAVGK
jgi:hypothetical protein